MTLSLADYLSDAGLDKWINALGVVGAPVQRAGVKEALRFFCQQMPRLPAAMALEFVRAMDLSKPVRPVLLQPGERLLAFRSGSEPPFKTFFTRRGQSRMTSGINAEGRSPVHFTVRSAVWALESFTAGTVDTWSPAKPGQRTTVVPRLDAAGVMVLGGGVQLIVPESYSHLLVQG